jgi:Ni,Fe-hydrogenase III large subunit
VAPPGTGYCRRGIEELASGKTIAQALDIVERSCGFAGNSARTLVCQALEMSMGMAPSPRARLVRAIFAEIERMLARLWNLGSVARAAGMLRPFHDALEQREVLFDSLVDATGERVFWAIAQPGGVRDLDGSDHLESIKHALDQLGPAVETWKVATAPRGPFGRAGAGVARITEERAAALHLTGLSARASGIARDVRRDAPYGAYADIEFDWREPDTTPASGNGDAAARMAIASMDFGTSWRLARAFLDALPSLEDTPATNGHVRTDKDQECQSVIEGPHGEVRATVTLSQDESINQLSLRTPGRQLVDALPEILQGLRIDLVPLALASLDLCLECVDL